MKSILSIDFVKERCRGTRVCQDIIFERTGWLGLDKPLADWLTDSQQLQALYDDEMGARHSCRWASGSWQVHAGLVQEHTREVVGFGRIRYRKNPDAASLFGSLRTDAKSRPDILAQAQAARDAWQQTEPAWVPREEFTLAFFSGEIDALFDLQKVSSEKQIAFKKTTGTLMNKARAVDDDCVAWYAEATRRFPAGTVEGDTIRSTVPTTYRPAKKVEDTQLTVTGLGHGTARVELSAVGAAKFSLWHRLVGAPQWELVTKEAKPGAVDMKDLVAGEHAFKAQGRNSRRKGVESSVVILTVASGVAA